MTRDRILAFAAFVLATVSAVLPWMADMGSYLLGWDGDIKGTQIPIRFLASDFEALENSGSGTEPAVGALVIAVGLAALVAALLHPRIRRIVLWVAAGIGLLTVAVFLFRLSGALDSLESSEGLLSHVGIGLWVFCIAIVLSAVAGFLVRTAEPQDESSFRQQAPAPLPGEMAARAAFTAASPKDEGRASPYSPDVTRTDTPLGQPAATPRAGDAAPDDAGSAASPVSWEPPPPSSVTPGQAGPILPADPPAEPVPPPSGAPSRVDRPTQDPVLPGDAVADVPRAEGSRATGDRPPSPPPWEEPGGDPEETTPPDRSSTATPWLTSPGRSDDRNGQNDT